MTNQGSIPDELKKIGETVEKSSHKIKDAVEKLFHKTSNLLCVQDGLLDFDLIEKDVKRIHTDMKATGDEVLGSHLILDNEHNFMEIRTYTQKDDKTFVNTVKVEVKEVTNIPSEVKNELEEKGRVEIILEL
ncbi:hypothetical protein FJR38_08835 [Anabaena sp. UHCC 0253]|uniref:hypothetical protein n=1 Tax=Anabaena sp. UHCC 0253 TaxID=2590019 RepID=UPI0014455F75|nr:hypothetical protein [Anabaena sp. UHCC 0253]MTJ52758.1 hypothetical protein [Anabaena sp. UHCC 0253]